MMVYYSDVGGTCMVHVIFMGLSYLKSKMLSCSYLLLTFQKAISFLHFLIQNNHIWSPGSLVNQLTIHSSFSAKNSKSDKKSPSSCFSVREELNFDMVTHRDLVFFGASVHHIIQVSF
jgi:hypothetical protein